MDLRRSGVEFLGRCGQRGDLRRQPLDTLADVEERLTGRADPKGAALDLGAAVLHRLHGVGGPLLDLTDDLGDRPDLFLGALGQLAHFVGHDGEPAALLAGPSRLDRGVQREQVGFAGDRRDGVDDLPDHGTALSQIEHDS